MICLSGPLLFQDFLKGALQSVDCRSNYAITSACLNREIMYFGV